MNGSAGQRRAVLWSSHRGTPESVPSLHGVGQMFSCFPIVTVTKKSWKWYYYHIRCQRQAHEHCECTELG